MPYKPIDLEHARQHREMQERYVAYGEFRAWIEAKIAHLDQTWHQLTLDDAALQQLRGQRQVLADVKAYIDLFHRIDIDAETAKIREAGEQE